MTQRVLIKVVGFSDEERQTLDTLFRLSEDSPTALILWTSDLLLGPRLSLVDGEHDDSSDELLACLDSGRPMVWIGPCPPSRALRAFERPLAWPDVVESIAEVLADPMELGLGFDEQDSLDTQPSQIEPPAPRALIASGQIEHRLYLRARLALSGLTHADEASSAEQARDWMKAQHYVVTLLDFQLPGAGGWDFVRELTRFGPEPTRLIITKDRPSLMDRWRGRRAGAAAVLEKPPQPDRLQALLEGLVSK